MVALNVKVFLSSVRESQIRNLLTLIPFSFNHNPFPSKTIAINTIKSTPCTQKVKRSFIATIRYICVTSILFSRVGLCNHKSIETEHTFFIPYFMFQKIRDLIETKKEFFSSEEYSQLRNIIEKAEEREKDKKGVKAEENEKEKNVENKCSTSDELKAKGNEQFRNGDYDEAILTYTEAIELDPMNHVLYSNRAAAYAKSGLTENGIEDCLKAIEIDNSYVKAYIRLGDFYSEDDKEKAEETYLKGLEIDPANVSLKEKLERLKQKESIPKGNGKFDINEMMKNPEIMKMAQEMMGNKSKEELDEMLKNLMNNK